MVFVVPPPLGAQGAAPQAVAATEPQRPPFPPGRAPTVSIPDVLMRASRDSANMLDGRLITTTGFTMKYADGTYLARIVIICCAADGQPARMPASTVAARPLRAIRKTPGCRWRTHSARNVEAAIHPDDDRIERDAYREAREHLRVLVGAELLSVRH
jgi:hypothetical protein